MSLGFETTTPFSATTTPTCMTMITTIGSSIGARGEEVLYETLERHQFPTFSDVLDEVQAANLSYR